ncbi:MAG: phosphatidylglycerophosphatase A [Acidobacteria bacterium]|nr:phosphatidylglycerophosphatase A [Acidobacteriota bacterium]
MNRLALFIATCGYVGYAPVAPGTFGSAVGLALAWGVRRGASPAVEAAAMVLVVAIGVWASTATERQLGLVDPGQIVIDEVAGMLITLAFIPLTTTVLLVGFFTFRAFDILKPWPARRLERLPAGAGVMADDVMAALYGNAVMHGAIAVAPGWFA